MTRGRVFFLNPRNRACRWSIRINVKLPGSPYKQGCLQSSWQSCLHMRWPQSKLNTRISTSPPVGQVRCPMPWQCSSA